METYDKKSYDKKSRPSIFDLWTPELSNFELKIGFLVQNCIYIYIYIHILEVGGVSPFVKPPTGKSFRFVRACERARRGEAVWASERRFDCVARAVVRPV